MKVLRTCLESNFRLKFGIIRWHPNCVDYTDTQTICWHLDYMLTPRLCWLDDSQTRSGLSPQLSPVLYHDGCHPWPCAPNLPSSRTNEVSHWFGAEPHKDSSVSLIPAWNSALQFAVMTWVQIQVAAAFSLPKLKAASYLYKEYNICWVVVK